MENTKKIILIEPSVVERLKQKENACEDTLSRLDKDMQKILKSKLEDREKWTLYLQTLQRYLHFNEAKKHPLKLPIITNEDSDDTRHIIKDDAAVQTDLLVKEEPLKEDVFSNNSTYTHSHLMRLIPKTFKKKGEVLLNTILEHSDKVRWDDKGLVYLDNKPIPNSNIVDLFNDTLRKLKRPAPVGREEFSKALIDISVPLYCIGNPDLRDYMNRLYIQDFKETPKSALQKDLPLKLKKRARKISWERWTPY